MHSLRNSLNAAGLAFLLASSSIGSNARLQCYRHQGVAASANAYKSRGIRLVFIRSEGVSVRNGGGERKAYFPILWVIELRNR